MSVIPLNCLLLMHNLMSINMKLRKYLIQFKRIIEYALMIYPILFFGFLQISLGVIPSLKMQKNVKK